MAWVNGTVKIKSVQRKYNQVSPLYNSFQYNLSFCYSHYLLYLPCRMSAFHDENCTYLISCTSMELGTCGSDPFAS